MHELANQNIFLGSHLLSPMHVIREAASTLNFNSWKLASITSLLMNAVGTRDKDEYYEAIRLLLADPYPVSKKLTERLIAEENESIFYCCTGGSFVGLSRIGCQKLNTLARSYFPAKTTFCDFFRRCLFLNIEVTNISIKSFKEYESEIGPCMGDIRMSQVTENFEREVVERFIENYLKGIRGFRLINKIEDEGGDAPELFA